MRQLQFKYVLGLVLVLATTACATKPAPDFGGRWKPVNRFAGSTTEIPLYTSYVFQASPMDGTLKSMLERWARDAGMGLDYRLGSDFTLYRAVADIETPDAQQAVGAVSAAYASQGIRVLIDGNRIVVQGATAGDGGQASTAGSGS